jgi:hypothetical protein
MVETTSQEQPLGADAPLLVSIRGTARTEIRRDRRLSREAGAQPVGGRPKGAA